jgi:hypothetical protein
MEEGAHIHIVQAAVLFELNAFSSKFLVARRWRVDLSFI